MLLPNLSLFAGKEISLLAGTLQQGNGDLFVCTCPIDACIEYIYDILEFALGKSPLNGGH